MRCSGVVRRPIGARIAPHQLLIAVLQVVLPVVLLGAPLIVSQHGLDGAAFVVRGEDFGVGARRRA